MLSSLSHPEGCVSAQSLRQGFACGFEFFSNEAQAKEPGSHRVLGVFVLLWLWGSALGIFCHLAQCQAKLDVALELSRVKSALAIFGWVVKLEKSELDGSLGEGGVEVKHVVSRFVVMGVSGTPGSCVPKVCQLAHGGWLFVVELFKEVCVNHPAVASDACVVEVECFFDQGFMACHDVDQIPQGFCVVAVGSDMDVHSATVLRVGNGSAFAKGSDQLLQGFDVFVVKNRGDHFGLLAEGVLDADVLHDLPGSALVVFAGVAVVAAALMFDGVFGVEVFCDHLDGCLAGDACHFDLDPNRLFLHVFDLFCCVLHACSPLPSGHCIYHSKGDT